MNTNQQRDSVVGRLERLTCDMSAMLEDLANYENYVLDSEMSYDNVSAFVKEWRDEIRHYVDEMLEAKRRGAIAALQTIYNPIEPRDFSQQEGSE